jgi:poly-gamma-glutamate synthesis protein (capsule biosynthesis protein)
MAWPFRVLGTLRTLGTLGILAMAVWSCRQPGPAVLRIAAVGPEEVMVPQMEALQRAFPALRLVPAEIPAEIPAETGEAPDLLLEFHALWAADAPADFIPLSKTYLVPREDALAGRFNTTLEACREGRETLIPLEALEPPFVALRVDGLCLDDPAYPLVRLEGLTLRAGKVPDAAGPGEEKRAALEKALTPAALMPAPELFRLTAVGDLMLGRGAEAILFREGPRGLWGGADPLLAGADLAALNLEGALSSRGSPAAKTYTFRFSPASAGALGEAGIDLVLLANNHSFDWGPEAFTDTLASLDGAGIAAVGAGLNEAAAVRPWSRQKGGDLVRVFGLASFPREASGWDGLSNTAGPERPGILHAGRGGGERMAPLFDRETGEGEDRAAENLAAENPAVLDIVFFHGGQEWQTGPDGPTRRLYTGLIREGADLIIGSHPHIVQGFEWIQGRPVFWSLGNFVFAGMENTGGGDEGLLLCLTYWGKTLLYLEPYPLSLSGPRTDLAPLEKLELFYRRSRDLRENRAAPATARR